MKRPVRDQKTAPARQGLGAVDPPAADGALCCRWCRNIGAELLQAPSTGQLVMTRIGAKSAQVSG